jgi:phospholipid N-methyltransferase
VVIIVPFPANLSEVFEAVDIITGERAALKKIKLDDGKEGVNLMISAKPILLFYFENIIL